MPKYFECIICGKKIRTNIAKKYCSRECFDKSKEIKKCIICGNEFVKNSKNHNICSDKCRDEHQLQIKNITDFQIFKRDNFQCIYCGKSSIFDGVKLHIEHIYPMDRGGKNDLFNLATSCSDCNLSKSATILPMEIILGVWERNKKLNDKNIISGYDELVQVFNERYKNRIQ